MYVAGGVGRPYPHFAGLAVVGAGGGYRCGVGSQHDQLALEADLRLPRCTGDLRKHAVTERGEESARGIIGNDRSWMGTTKPYVLLHFATGLDQLREGAVKGAGFEGCVLREGSHAYGVVYWLGCVLTWKHETDFWTTPWYPDS